MSQIELESLHQDGMIRLRGVHMFQKIKDNIDAVIMILVLGMILKIGYDVIIGIANLPKVNNFPM